jgi:uncharacterized protein (TIGR03435 family)
MKISIGFVLAGSLFGAALAMAQSPAANEPQRFEIISIRQNLLPDAVERFGPTADGYQAMNTSLSVSLLLAYPPTSGQTVYPSDQIEGLPAWMREERYDVDARIDPEQLSVWQGPKAQQKLLPRLLQNLLAERCKLKAHIEEKEMASFSLVVAKGGPKFTESKPDAVLPAGVFMPGGGVMVPEEQGRVMHFYRIPLSVLTTVLSHMSGSPVVDRTGLKGKYDIVLDKGEPREGGYFNTAIEVVSQLGLKLVSQKNVVEILVIDHVERPSEN